MIKKLLFCLLALMVVRAKAQITQSITIPDPIPEYDGSYEDFGQNHFFYPNGGEIRYNNEEQGTAIEEAKFYTKYAWPQQYLLNSNNISFVFSKKDPAAGGLDSLHRIDLEMDGSNSTAFLARVDTQNTVVLNYFTQWFSSSGRTDVHGAASIACQSIWPNIDMVYTSNNTGLKIFYIIYPGGNLSDIVLHVNGSKSNAISGNDLVIDVNWDSMKFVKPKMYQCTIIGNIISPVNVCNTSWQSLGGDMYQISNSTSSAATYL